MRLFHELDTSASLPLSPSKIHQYIYQLFQRVLPMLCNAYASIAKQEMAALVGFSVLTLIAPGTMIAHLVICTLRQAMHF